MIVLHGGPGNDYRYLLPLKDLSDTYRVIFYDQRGTGLSPRVPATELTLDSSIEDLRRVIDHFAPGKKVHIIGHSWGAMLASGFLCRYPDRVDKIVLAEPGFLTSEMALEFVRRTNNFAIDLNLSNLVVLGRLFFESLHVYNQGTDAIKDYLFTNLITMDIPEHPLAGYFCNHKFDPATLPYWRYGMTASLAIQQGAVDEEGQIQIDLVSGVEAYPDTVLFFSGACNEYIGPDYQEGHLQYFPRHKMVVIENAGHNMLTEKPDDMPADHRDHFKTK